MTGSKLFGRRWAVTVGPPGAEGKRWEDIDIEFEVEKNGSSTPNKIELTLFNLSPASRGFIEKRKLAVLLEAGYEDELTLIASGEIHIATHVKDGPDRQTKITAADGLTAYGAVVHEALGPGTSEEEVVRKLAKRLGVKVGTIQGFAGQKFAHGRMLSGPARFEMDSICRSRALRWSIHDGALVVYPVGKSAKSAAEAVLLTPDSGLIGSPEKTEKGWKVTTLLRGGINPGDPVKIKSEDVDGVFVAEKVTHVGQSRGNDWYSHIVAVKL